MRLHSTYCFWCDVRFSSDRRSLNFTRDHIIPASLGGELGDNLVPSCRGCNDERAIVLSFAYLMVEVVESGRMRIRTKTAAQQPFVEKLWRKWSAVELERLGWSFTADLDVNIPAGVAIFDPPKVTTFAPYTSRVQAVEPKGAYMAVLKEARRRAERLMLSTR